MCTAADQSQSEEKIHLFSDFDWLFITIILPWAHSGRLKSWEMLDPPVQPRNKISRALQIFSRTADPYQCRGIWSWRMELLVFILLSTTTSFHLDDRGCVEDETQIQMWTICADTRSSSCFLHCYHLILFVRKACYILHEKQELCPCSQGWKNKKKVGFGLFILHEGYVFLCAVRAAKINRLVMDYVSYQNSWQLI